MGVCILLEPLAQVSGKVPLRFPVRWTSGEREIVTRAAADMREMMLSHKPCLYDHGITADLTEAFA